MDIKTFFARVIGPGAYMAIAYKHADREGGMSHRFFKRDDVNDAIDFLNWTYRKTKSDAYFALGTFTEASIADKIDNEGRPKDKLLRTAANVETMAALFCDLDVARPGDGKDPTKTFADERAALTWLLGFCKATGVPEPNIIVKSGYGFHIYWTLAQALTRADWQPLADALKLAMHESGYVGDAQRIADAASILRPPGSINRKGGGIMPVEVKSDRPDYSNQVIYDALKPWIGKGPTTTVVQPSALLGPMPAHLQNSSLPNQVAAAQAGIGTTYKPSSFARLAGKCLQVKQSLATNGATDKRPLWYLGHLSLAAYCEDGDQFVHEISKGHHGYTPAGTDAQFAQAQLEKATKNAGPPRCTSYDTNNPGVCVKCPFFGRVKSPRELGIETNDLPKNFRHEKGWLEANVKVQAEYKWVKILEGEVSLPYLDVLPGNGRALNFTYEFAGKRVPVRCEEHELTGEASAITTLFVKQGVALEKEHADNFRRFIVAWIKHMRRGNEERDEIIRPFGYSVDKDGQRTGLAVGGTLYRPDGTKEHAAGGDPAMNAAYTPHGDASLWRQTYDLVCKDQVALQAIVATAFAAPLLSFTGQSGLIVSAASIGSGAAKSTALKLAHAVWAAKTQLLAINPTHNAVMDRLGKVSVISVNWDEMTWARSKGALVEVVMNVSQGSGKARMDQKLNQREILQWSTMLVVAGNCEMLDLIEAEVKTTDATALRVLEFLCPKVETDPTTVGLGVDIDTLIQRLETNYGHTGAAYAAYIAANLPSVAQWVTDCLKLLRDSWQARNDERLYFAGIASILVGAQIANSMGLTDFDMAGLRELFYGVILKSRAKRAAMVVQNGKHDIEQIYAQFQTDHIGNYLVTKQFIKRGKRPTGWTPNAGVFRVPTMPGVPAYIHLSIEDKMLWVNKVVFMEWCRKKGYTPGAVINDMKQQWGVMEARRVIGAGTNWLAGQLPVLEIPVSDPKMAHLIPMFEKDNEQIKALGLPEQPEYPSSLENLPEAETTEAA